ncbi:MAG TPA: hypothetical protein PLP52_11360 [Syntrophorhabdaceae bacterium]|nr:hypothetical protein [Syntrophorhabdaceae bacterium]HQK47526.1 hypothetical protein [Syntrophorhabdaceae bacterium]HRV23299.1 hypothetical protein [Syntrophorhabdaceae bacterium]
MDEKDLTQKLYEMFEAVITSIENVSNGFLSQNQALLQKGETQFLGVLSSNLEFAETIIKKEKKSEADEKFIGLLIPLQEIALAVRNLISKEKAILQRNVIFSVKAVMEITDLLKAIKQQFIDTKDYIFTKNPTLKENVKSGKDKIIKMADEYALMHEGRLIAGICGTKASYLYLSLIGSIKTVAKELVSFSERI